MNCEQKRSEVKQQSSLLVEKTIHASTNWNRCLLTDLGLGRCPIALTAPPGEKTKRLVLHILTVFNPSCTKVFGTHTFYEGGGGGVGG